MKVFTIVTTVVIADGNQPPIREEIADAIRLAASQMIGHEVRNALPNVSGLGVHSSLHQMTMDVRGPLESGNDG